MSAVCGESLGEGCGFDVGINEEAPSSGGHRIEGGGPTTPTKEEQVPKRTVAPPPARPQPPKEDPGLRLMLHAVTLLFRTQPELAVEVLP
jgi:hypothetical protein